VAVGGKVLALEEIETTAAPDCARAQDLRECESRQLCVRIWSAKEDASRLSLGDELSGVSQMTYEDSFTNMHAYLDDYLVG
jgi:hypothetical protein